VFVRFVGCAHRSLEEVITGLDLCQRISPSLPASAVTTVIDEGNQISRMAHSLKRRLGTSTEPRAW
jgi:four helix bundle protein